ncbi:MAG: AAA family ATPase [Gemmatimonas sp.]|nr:AAA family ATPase [Gemmatimonas sp.]
MLRRRRVLDEPFTEAHVLLLRAGNLSGSRRAIQAIANELGPEWTDRSARLAAVPAEAWDKVVGPAVLDEVQKLPGAIEKLKWSYDEGRIDFSVLAGSSQVLLLEQVRETLAGACFSTSCGR